MNKTTLYLPDELKRAVTQEARRRGTSEAEIIRASLQATLPVERPRPRGGILTGVEPISHRVDELLAEGFGKS